MGENAYIDGLKDADKKANLASATELNVQKQLEANESFKLSSTANVQAIKMDALWKPIIRKFRQFIKVSAMNKLRYEVDESKSITELGLIFGKILDVPSEILSEERV